MVWLVVLVEMGDCEGMILNYNGFLSNFGSQFSVGLFVEFIIIIPVARGRSLRFDLRSMSVPALLKPYDCYPE